MNILSIDWDYFFPDLSGFDWGMNESRSFMTNRIWDFRYHSFNMLTKEPAKNLKPKFSNFFWSVVQKYVENARYVFVHDSHKEILNVIEKGDIIFNFDQHHDCGYSKTDDRYPLHCGNWALETDISQYHLRYPAWRRTKKERPGLRVPDSISFDFEPLPQFDIIFICRSGGWTPSWCDSWWIEFLYGIPVDKSKIAIEVGMDVPRPLEIIDAFAQKL